jgi:hypothetical protein
VPRAGTFVPALRICGQSDGSPPIGVTPGHLSILLLGLLPDEQLYSWGWRVPFLVSYLLIAAALYVRLRVEESPVFRRMLIEQQVIKLPVLETLRSYPRNLLIGVGAHIADTACASLYATFTVAYATSTLDISCSTVLTGVIMLRIVVMRCSRCMGAVRPHRTQAAEPVLHGVHGGVPQWRAPGDRSLQRAGECAPSLRSGIVGVGGYGAGVAGLRVKRAYRYRFYPTPVQAAELSRTFGCVRLVYNRALEARSAAWHGEQRRVSYAEPSAMLTEWKGGSELAFLNEVSSVPLQQCLRHLQAGFAAFWDKRARYPRFKSRKRGKQSA